MSCWGSWPIWSVYLRIVYASILIRVTSHLKHSMAGILCLVSIFEHLNIRFWQWQFCAIGPNCICINRQCYYPVLLSVLSPNPVLTYCTLFIFVCQWFNCWKILYFLLLKCFWRNAPHSDMPVVHLSESFLIEFEHHLSMTQRTSLFHYRLYRQQPIFSLDTI